MIHTSSSRADAFIRFDAFSVTSATTGSNLQDGTAVAAVRDVGLAHPEHDASTTAAEEEDEEDEIGGSSDEEEVEAVDAPETTGPVASTSAPVASETLPEYQKGAAAATAGDVKEKPTLSTDAAPAVSLVGLPDLHTR